MNSRIYIFGRLALAFVVVAVLLPVFALAQIGITGNALGGQAEEFGVQQELAEFARKARIRQAQRYRAEWDAREAEVGDRLGGAFDVGTGTAFFGQPAGPNSDGAAILSQVDGGEGPALRGVPDVSDSDTSVVDLRGSSGVVQLFRPPTMTLTPGHVPPLPRSTARGQHRRAGPTTCRNPRTHLRRHRIPIWRKAMSVALRCAIN